MTPTPDIKKRFGERLRRARLMRGLSLRDLAEKLRESGHALSHAALEKYEKGQSGPNSTILMALAGVFGLDAGYFFRFQTVELGAIEFRKQTKFPQREVSRVREEAADFFEKVLQMEAVLEISRTPLPRVDLTALASDDEDGLNQGAEKAAVLLRQKWKLGEDALPNVREMLEEYGVLVKEVEAPESFNGFSGWADERTPVIVLACWLDQDLPRKRLTALHELGHLVMKLPEGISRKLKESLCYRFAGAALLPASALRRRVGGKRTDGISYRERMGIKADWGISIAALMRRCADLGIITASQYKSFCFQNRNSRKSEPGHWVGTERADRFEQMVFRAASQELITRAKAAEMLGVSLRGFDELFSRGAELAE